MGEWSERVCVDAISDTIRRTRCCEWVRVRTRPSVFRRSDGSDGQVSAVVVQPDIDIAMKSSGPSPLLSGIEVKFVKKGKRASFYKGIGQALSLFRLGFDNAALWVVFEEEEALCRLGALAWYFTRNQMCLPLDFTALLASGDPEGRPRFSIWQYKDARTAKPVADLGSSGVSFHHRNPLLYPVRDKATWSLREEVMKDFERKVRPADRSCSSPEEGNGRPGEGDVGPTGPAWP